MEKYKEIERSIIKKFRKDIWSKFVKGVSDYYLINEGDHIMCCISGGKDSFLMAKCLEELEHHGNVPFKVDYVCMNPGYNDYNLNMIKDNAKILNVKLEFFNSDIFDIVEKESKSPCYLCAKMRRGCLYKEAERRGCNKIALGHHFDDVIETNLLSILYSSEIRTMMPCLHSEHYKGIDLIRPLYLVREKSIIAWRDYNNLTFINCACRFTEGCSIINDGTSKRKEVKELIKALEKKNKNAAYNIFKAYDNVNLACVLGTKKDGVYRSFLEDYNAEK